MSELPTFAEGLLPPLSAHDAVFVQTVLDHQGVSDEPSLAEFTAALKVLRSYYEQSLDNPPTEKLWQPRGSEEGMAALRAKAFMLFGATKPTPDQWRRASAALYGPLLCATCG